MNLTVRMPEINFEECFPVWSPSLEFAMALNAFSTIPVYLEPYIIKTMVEAKQYLDPVEDAALLKEIDWFNAQEGQHYRQHARFNRIFETPRYPRTQTLVKQYGAELDDYRASRSLLFNLAYVEGFEASASVFCQLWFDKMGRFKQGANEEAISLYNWHFAEEFEHREIAYKVYMRIACRGNIFRRIWYGYFYRIFGVLAMLGHAGKYIDAVRRHLLEVEWRELPEEMRRKSEKADRKLGAWFFTRTVAGLLAVLSPFYNPANKKIPRGLASTLADFEPGGRFGKKIKSS